MINLIIVFLYQLYQLILYQIISIFRFILNLIVIEYTLITDILNCIIMKPKLDSSVKNQDTFNVC